MAVQVFLRMCGLDFQVLIDDIIKDLVNNILLVEKVEMRSNAEHMSPSGKLPFIKCGAFVVADLDPVVSFVSNKVT